MKDSRSSSSSFERASTPGPTKTGLGPRVYLLLPQAAELPGSNDVVKPAFKIVRPRVPCGARCMGLAIRTWSTVCSAASHSQFGEGTRPHLCMDEWNHPIPVLKQLSLIQAARDKPISTGLAR